MKERLFLLVVICIVVVFVNAFAICDSGDSEIKEDIIVANGSGNEIDSGDIIDVEIDSGDVIDDESGDVIDSGDIIDADESGDEIDSGDIIDDDVDDESGDEEVHFVAENGVPLVIIRIDESQEAIDKANTKDDEHEYGTIEDMNGSENHSVRCVGTVEIILPEGYESEYGSNAIPEGEQPLSYIRGRGNSTWGSLKKPYKIKYDKKQDILGMGENKEWGLLANSMDKTLTNNAVAMWIADQMEMEFANKMLPVEVIMIGSESGQTFLGSYYITELVDIGKSRVNIPELDKDDTAETGDITGGYLISIYYDSQDSDEPRSTVFKTDKSQIEFINENPSFESEDLTDGQAQQRKYIRDYVNEIDDLIMSNDAIDEETHNKIAELLDLESMAKYWLIQEFLINYDAYKTSSNYLYKKPNGKLFWGPLWDFDLMYFDVEKDDPTTAVGFNNSKAFAWVDRLRNNDPLFIDIIKEIWKSMDKVLINLTKQGGTLDKYKERQRKAWNHNYEIWGDILYYEEVDFDKEIEKLRDLIDFRREWFNKNIDELDKVFFKATYEVDGKVVKEEKVRGGSYIIDVDLDEPTKKGYIFKDWVNKETGDSFDSKSINGDVTFIPDFVSTKEIIGKTSMFFSTYEDWVPLSDETYGRLSTEIFPKEYEDILFNSIDWTSSNEDIATLDGADVYLHDVGDVTITGTLFDGTKKSYLLHVYDSSNTEIMIEPEDFVLDKYEYTIEVGDVDQITYHFLPNKPIDPNNWIDVEFSSDNEEVVETGYSSCLCFEGLKEGKATLTVTVYSSASDDKIFTKEVIVNVKAKKKSSGVSSSSSSKKSTKGTTWSKVDDWALEEMKKAEKQGLIPETFKDKDFTATIKREDFCAVAVKLYEAITGKKVTRVGYNPFKDITDDYVIKAYHLGITVGVSNTEFGKGTITREQMSTMIVRSLTKAKKDTNIDLDKITKFADDNEMHGWGRPSIYFMSSKGIIQGVGDNRFDPLGEAKIEEAIAIALRCLTTL